MFYVKKGKKYAAQDSNEEQGKQFYWGTKAQALKFTNEYMAEAHAKNNLKDGEVVEE